MAEGAWPHAPALDRCGAPLAARVAHGFQRGTNWLQPLKFGLVGASGYAVNLAVYGALLTVAGVDFRLAAVAAFLVAVTNNYTWNRLWTFRDRRGHIGYQGLRFFAVSSAVLGGNLVLLSVLVLAGFDEVTAQATAVALFAPMNFLGNKLWSFRR
jgi:putative flippase GtrA